MVETNPEVRRANRQQKLKRRKRMHRILAIILAVVCIVTAIVIVAALFSSDTYRDEDGFREYAASYFKEVDEPKSVGEEEERVQYGTPLSVAMEYPVLQKETTDTYIKNIVKGIEKDFYEKYKKAGKEDKIAMLMDYDAYKTQREAIGIVFSEEQRAEKERVMETEDINIYAYNFSTENGKPLTAIQIFNTGYRKFCSDYMQEYFKKEYSGKLVKDYKKSLADRERNFNKFVLTEKGVTFYFEPGTVVGRDEGVVTAEMTYEDLEGIIRDQIVIKAIDPKKPMVALTFDDGPFPKSTNRILDCLEKYNVPATFFDLGQNIAAYPQVVKREAELGMEIGSHSWSHPNLKEVSEKEVRSQIKKTNHALKQACGQSAAVFRPPYGNSSKAVEKYAEAPIILWSVDTLDWKSRNAGSVMNVVKSVKDLDGRVILMHSIYDSTAQAVEEMVPWLLQKGYQIVTVSDLMEYKYKETPKNGKLYGYGYFYLDK